MTAARRGMDVIRSIEDAHGGLCVDFIERPDGRIVYKVYRKDPEDYGRWSLLADASAVEYVSLESAYAAARVQFAWLAPLARP